MKHARQVIYKALRWLLMIALVVCGVSGIGNQERANAKSMGLNPLFDTEAPQGFKVLQRGSVPKATGKKGRYLLMTNPKTKTMALVIEVIPRDVIQPKPGTSLNTHDLSQLTEYLLKQFVGLGDFKINVEKDRWLRLEGDPFFHTQWLRIKFKDGFEEADTVIRLHYPQGRQTILLMGRPATGGYDDCPTLRKDYFMLENQSIDLIQTYHLEKDAFGDIEFNRLSHYLGNLFKSHLKKNCFVDER